MSAVRQSWTAAQGMCKVDAMAGSDHRIIPVGTVEIADRFGVARTTVDHWRIRDDTFPQPATLVGGRPAWHWPDVERWGKVTGRTDLLKAAAAKLAAGKPGRARKSDVPAGVVPLANGNTTLEDRQPVSATG